MAAILHHNVIHGCRHLQLQGPNCDSKAGCYARAHCHKKRQRGTSLVSQSAAVGIDLGTTNSVIAILTKGDKRPTVITDASGCFTVPSVVAYNAAGSMLVGQPAKQQAVTNPLNTFYSVKRLMGRQFKDVEGLDLVYQIVDDPQSGVQLVCPATGGVLSPEQVSAEVLRHLLHLASQKLSGEVPQQVVITVPAYFTQQQRAATLKAAQLAGIKRVSLLQEPVAAAMAFGFGKPFDAETLLVFDLGGGTFDMSVVDSFEGIMEVLATNGNAQLGGDDFDRALVAWLQQQQQQLAQCSNGSSGKCVQQPHKLSPDVLAAALEAVEAAKCKLSQHEVAAVQLSALQSQPHQQQQQQQSVLLTRQQMHAATASLREQLWQPLQPLAEDCKLELECPPCGIEQQLAVSPTAQQQQQQQQHGMRSNGTAAAGARQDPYAPRPRKLTAVLLVGGATRMPIIQQGLQIVTGLQPRSDVDPEQAVALGAAIQAAVLLGLSSGLELMDGSYVEEQHNRSTGIH